MAKVFAITPVTDKLKADANGHTTTVFTVTNDTSRPLRGIAKIRTEGKTEASWIKIEGETERDFPAGGTHQFTVNFTKPKPPTLPHPAETFEFRLDAISAENPDEDFAEGPKVTVEIPEQKEETKKFPWWILIVIGILLMVGVVIAILLIKGGGGDDPEPTPTPTATATATATATPTPTPTPAPEKVEVPDLTKKTFSEAEKELNDKQLKAEKIIVNAPDKEADKIFKQDPEAGKKVDPASTVKLSVPDICNKNTGQCVWLGQYLLHNVGFPEGTSWSITPDIRPNGHFLFGPYISLQDYGTGEYRAFWEMKVDNNSRDVNVVTIDVFTLRPVGRTYATQVIKANQFVYPNASQQFTLDFVVTDPSLKYEFRVAYWGNVKLTVEKIGIQKK